MGSKGRPKLYDGKIDMEHLKEDYFEITQLEDRTDKDEYFRQSFIPVH